MNNNIVQNNKRIAKNSFLLFIRMLFSMAVSLYTTRAILEILGITDFGIYNVVGGVIVFFSFINQTMSTTTSRFITTALGKNDESLLKKTFCMSLNLHIIIAFITILIGETLGLWFVLNKLIIPTERIDAALLLYHASVVSTCINILNVPYNATIIAHEDMGAFAYISIMQVISKLIIVLVLPLINADRLIIFSVLTVFVSIAIQAIYWFYSYKKYNETKFFLSWDKNIWKEISGFASWNIISDLAFMCNTQGLNILLNIFYGPIVNAARGIAVQVESVILQFIGNVQTAITPQITKNYAMGNINQTISLTLKASKFSFFLMLILAIPIFLEIEQILEFWLKNIPKYTIIFIKLTILIASLDCLSRPLHLVINATGHVRTYQIIQSSLFISFLPISYVLQKLYNIQPEIIISLLAIFKLIILLIRIDRVKILINLSPIEYLKKVIIPSSYCLILSFIPPILIISTINPSLYRIFITFTISFISSIIIIYNGGFTKNEKGFIRNEIKKLAKNVF